MRFIIAFLLFSSTLYGQIDQDPCMLISSLSVISSSAPNYTVQGSFSSQFGYTRDSIQEGVDVMWLNYTVSNPDRPIRAIIDSFTVISGNTLRFYVELLDGETVLAFPTGTASIYRPTTNYNLILEEPNESTTTKAQKHNANMLSIDAAIASIVSGTGIDSVTYSNDSAFIHAGDSTWFSGIIVDGTVDSTIYATVYSRDTAAAAIRGEIAALAQPPFDSSDIATGGIGNTDLAAGIVGTTKLTDDGVTLAKMASGTANRLIVYDGSGNPAVGTVSGILSLSAGNLAATEVDGSTTNELETASQGLHKSSMDFRLGGTYFLNHPSEFSAGRKLNWGSFITYIGTDNADSLLTYIFDIPNKRLGVGTAPSTTFHVLGTTRLAGTTDFYNGAGGRFWQSGNSTYAELIFRATGVTGLAFDVAGGETMRLAGVGLGIGTISPTSRLHIAGNIAASAWGLNGIQSNHAAATYTNNSTSASATITNTVANSFGIPTFAATNANVTTTNAATIYVAGAPIVGGANNFAITNPYSFWVDGGSTRIDGELNLNGSPGTAGQVLISSGAGAVPIWGTSSGCQETITQSSHGFVAGDVLYWTGTDYDVVDGNFGSVDSPTGVVYTVTDANNFVLATCGVLDTDFGLADGAYFATNTGLSSTSATPEMPVLKVEGAISIVAPLLTFDDTGVFTITTTNGANSIDAGETFVLKADSVLLNSTNIGGAAVTNLATAIDRLQNGSVYIVANGTADTITITNEYFAVTVNTNTNAETVRLPAPASIYDNVIVTVKQIGSASNAITISAVGGASIFYETDTTSTSSTISAGGTSKSYMCLNFSGTYYWIVI